MNGHRCMCSIDGDTDNCSSLSPPHAYKLAYSPPPHYCSPPHQCCIYSHPYRLPVPVIPIPSLSPCSGHICTQMVYYAFLITTSCCLQCFDTVGLVIWPVKLVPKMTYDVLNATLSLYTTTTTFCAVCYCMHTDC